MIRAYVPSTLPEVLIWYGAGLIPAGTAGHAVTAALREAHPDADEEELEFFATKAAQEVSTLTAVTTGHRRAILAVDVAPGEVAADAGMTSMTLLGDVPRAAWAALFVDELEWYAIDEIPHLR